MNDEEKLSLGDAVKRECIKVALEEYENAQINGLCHEGAWECAVDALRSLNISEIIKKLDNYNSSEQRP